MPEVYGVELPPEVKRLLNVFSLGVSFGLGGVGSMLECLDLRGYVATLALYMITPVVMVAFAARMPAKSRRSFILFSRPPCCGYC